MKCKNFIKEQISNNPLYNEQFPNTEEIKIHFPCPKRPWLKCEKAKTTKINIESEYMLGIYCEDTECMMSDSNVLFDNEAIIINLEKEKEH